MVLSNDEAALTWMVLLKEVREHWEELREHTGLPSTAPVDETSDWSAPTRGMCVQWGSLGYNTFKFLYSWRLTAEELGTSRKRLRIFGFLERS